MLRLPSLLALSALTGLAWLTLVVAVRPSEDLLVAGTVVVAVLVFVAVVRVES